jgi:hypothetical protein
LPAWPAEPDYIERVATPDLCSELTAWSSRYPVPSAPAERNDAARLDEDRFLGRFAGLAALDRDQAADLVGWKFQGMAHRRALALRGISPVRSEPASGGPGPVGGQAGGRDAVARWRRREDEPVIRRAAERQRDPLRCAAERMVELADLRDELVTS